MPGKKKGKSDVYMACRLQKPIVIDATAGGVITYRPRTTPLTAGSLPIFSVDTEDEAKTLQVLLCKQGWAGDYILNPHLRTETTRGQAAAWTEAFARAYLAMKKRSKT